MASTTLDVKVNFCSLDTRGKPHEEGNGHFAVPIKPATLPWKQVPALTFCIGWIDLSSVFDEWVCLEASVPDALSLSEI